MKIVTCASYYGSGSSALTDLVAEYSDVMDLTNYEFRFLYDLDGVTDLEYHLCECHDRHNSGHALKRFERLSKFNSGTFFNSRYEPFFDNQYYKLTSDYISKLTTLSYPGWWFYDVYDKGRIYYYIVMLINKLFRKLTHGNKGILPNERILCAHPSEEEFLSYTREYVSKLMEAANSERKPYIEIDQLVPSQNINKVLRYFSDDIYVFIVDRDPRDIYISNKFYWKEHICPTDDVNKFCDWFIYTRESGVKERYDDQIVCKLRFEDLIYNYQETVERVEKITGLNHMMHKKQFQKFNPKRSINNTQLWKKHNVEEEIKIIEKRLSKYLFPFSDVENNVICGIESTETTVF